MKRFAASVALVLAALSEAGAQEPCFPNSKPDLAGVGGSTIAGLVGSTLGDGRGQTIATGAAAFLGAVIGQSMSPPSSTASMRNPLVHEFDTHRTQAMMQGAAGEYPCPENLGRCAAAYG